MSLIITPIEIAGGTLSYLIIHGIVFVLKKLLSIGVTQTERALAIRRHYHKKALKKGHDEKNILLCSDGMCTLL